MLIGFGTLKTVEQVYDELRRWPHLQEHFKPIKKQFLIDDQHASSVASLVGQIAEDFEFLFDQSGTQSGPGGPLANSCCEGFRMDGDYR